MNETYSCESSPLLNGILKKELGFQGYVMSDFFATHSGVNSANGGLDMNIPGDIDNAAIGTGNSYFGSRLVEAVTNGSVSMSRMDDMVTKTIIPYFLLGQDKDFPTVDPSSADILKATFGIPLGYEEPARDVRANHASLIRKLGAAGTVLLKNLNSTLPLQSPRNIGVFGNDAPGLTGGLTFLDSLPPFGFEFGILDIGGGSGSGRHTPIVSPLEAIKARAKLTGARVQYITDNTVLAANQFQSIYPTPDVCLVFLKTFSSEGKDRLSFELDWNSTLVVNNVAKHCPNTVVITHSAGVNTLPWSSNPNVTAILTAHYPGEETGDSIVDILRGDVNPSGKLPYTIPATEADYYVPIINITNATSPNAWQSNFTDGLFIDYRHFDAKNITPLCEFGYGLSYTNFSIASPLSVKTLISKPSELPDVSLPIVPGGNPDLWTELLSLSTAVSNIGRVEGAAVIQLYVSLSQDSVPLETPTKVLRGFQKINLKPGEKKDLEFSITRRDISFWDTTVQQWRLPKGKIIFRVGFSSRDFKQTAEVQLQ
jgi:beta-glucosidase